MWGMGAPLLISGLLLMTGTLAVAADSKSAGRLASGCLDRSISPEFCKWVTRYQAKDAPVLPGRSERTPEQRAVEQAAGEYLAVQPAQIQGNRASILAQRQTGEFVVLALEKKEGAWTILSVAEPETVRR